MLWPVARVVALRSRMVMESAGAPGIRDSQYPSTGPAIPAPQMRILRGLSMVNVEMLYETQIKRHSAL
jgi:hypothetical protein